MLKYFVAASLLVTAGSVISIIDSRSTRVMESSRSGDEPLRTAEVIYATGVVEGATEEINLRAEQFGRVREVLVTAGQLVKTNEVLIRLDDAGRQQESALASARLELAKAELDRLTNGARQQERDEAQALVRAARAHHDQAARSFKRMGELRSNRAITEQELEDQQALVDTSQGELEAAEARAERLEAPARADELRSAEARVTAAQAELNLANIHLAKCEVRAPRAGRVLDLHVEPGELTGPDAREPLIILSDTSVVRVRAYVEELDAPRVRVGMGARVKADGLPNESFNGKVVSISPQMTSKSQYSDHPRELYDTKVREVVIELNGLPPLIVALRVDVNIIAASNSQDK
jgi:multidrug resistance efflux pump